MKVQNIIKQVFSTPVVPAIKSIIFIYLLKPSFLEAAGFVLVVIAWGAYAWAKSQSK